MKQGQKVARRSTAAAPPLVSAAVASATARDWCSSASSATEAKVPTGDQQHKDHYIRMVMIVAVDMLNIRENPGTREKQVGLLRRTTPVEIMEKKGAWGRIKRGGWVALRYLSRYMEKPH